MAWLVDDEGEPVPLTSEVSRIVSLVPSLTEALASSCPQKLLAATDWCTHPADLAVARVGGTKNPDLAAIAALEPDLVVTHAEENRRVDIDALRSRGIAVWVTDIRTVDQALTSIGTLLSAVGADDTGWLGQARVSWENPPTSLGRRLRAVVPIWRRPWMYLGRDTYAGDVLRRLGLDNVLGEHPDRYPKLLSESCPRWTWSSYLTSLTSSTMLMARRRFLACPVLWSVGASSPGTGRPWSRHPKHCGRHFGQR